MSNVIALNKEIADKIEAKAKQSVADLAKKLIETDFDIRLALKERILLEIRDPKIEMYWRYNDSYKDLIRNVINEGEVWELVRNHYISMLGDNEHKKYLLDSAAYEIGLIIVSELREAK